jgi:hypothetical protein
MSTIPDVMDDAKNLRYLVRPIFYTPNSGDTTMVITPTLPDGKPMPDANYGVLAMANWNTLLYLSAKTAGSFTLTFSNHAGYGYAGAANTLQVAYAVMRQ